MKIGWKEILLFGMLVVLSFSTRFIFFGSPNEVVFDEVHYGKYVSGYFTGQYFFDVHPPLAKLLMAGAGFLGGFSPDFDFEKIGESFGAVNFLALRFLPTLLGFLLPLVLYTLCRNLNFSKIASGMAALLLIFENSILVQSRFILPDVFLLFFGFAGLSIYFYYRKNHQKVISRYLFALSVVLAVFAGSVKWTGLTFLAIIGVSEFVFLTKNREGVKNWLINGAIFVCVSVFAYLSVFAVHFALLSKDGQGKAFMSSGFQKTLAGNQYEKDDSVQALGWFDKFIELNKEMYTANDTIGPHRYGSVWYKWPLLKRPIYYWVKSGTEEEAKIYLLGNPVIYWSGFASVLFLLSYFWTTKRKALAGFLLFGYFLNFLPFAFIGRVMFLYHYFPALIFSIMVIAFLIDEIKNKKNKKYVASAAIIVSVLFFLYFSPLTYGISLPKDALNNRFWFNSWQ